MNLILREKWRLASSGVSVDAGPIRVRLEAGARVEDRIAIASAISELPAAINILERARTVLIALEPDPVAAILREEIKVFLRRVGARL